MGISLGIVGLGSFGSSFVDLFAAHPLVDRIALCDREADRIAVHVESPAVQAKFQPSDAYDSLDAICQSDLDAIAIITQPWLHAPQAIQVLQSGKHVYSAVPVISIPDSDEILEWCDKLVSTVERTGLHYMLGETTYYRSETVFCRKQAAAGAFGHFVYSEGEYLHDVDSPNSNLRAVQKRRLNSAAGREWLAHMKQVQKTASGIYISPMHYPTHSTSGPMSVMGAHAVNVSAFGYRDPNQDEYYGDNFSNETALFQMSNGTTMRICEFRQIGHKGIETLRVFGTEGSFRDNQWVDRASAKPISVDTMRDPLPAEVETDYQSVSRSSNIYGGHGGSHAYLVHEFVDAIAHDRIPAINVWEAVRYMAAGVVAHQSALRDGERLTVPDWGDAPS
ncbi:MAG: Gfo/Idh/MocA family oxidoreductase [Chloroflexota bacterium]